MICVAQLHADMVWPRLRRQIENLVNAYKGDQGTRSAETMIKQTENDEMEAVRQERDNGQEAKAVLMFLEAAALVEAGWDDLCDLCLFVETDITVATERNAKGKNGGFKNFEERWALQMSSETFSKRLRVPGSAIKNDGDLDLLLEAARKHCDKLLLA